MGREMFLIVLAALTLVTGIALMIMARRRRSSVSDEDAAPAVDAAEDTPEAPSTGARGIDEYAIPVSFERARDLLDDEVDIGKICPRCGARYGSHHRFCERDNSELAALN